MSSMTEKKDSHSYQEKDHVLTELGVTLATRDALSPEDDRRILRRIDMQ
jgi:hypothetical protein